MYLSQTFQEFEQIVPVLVTYIVPAMLARFDLMFPKLFCDYAFVHSILLYDCTLL